MTLTFAASFYPSLDSHLHTVTAEQLGYSHAWFFDSPAVYADVWTQLCRAAERTNRIGLGPGVMVPSMRHPMVAAASIIQLVEMAGAERVKVAVGTGFSARLTMGKKPLTWAYVKDYVSVLQALLRGETATWDGAKVKMLHWEGFGAKRPSLPPFLFGVGGPKGFAVARDLGGGVIVTDVGDQASLGFSTDAYDQCIVGIKGTVLDRGETVEDERVVLAAGPMAAVHLHFANAFEDGGEVVDGAAGWLDAYADVEGDEIHLAMHEGHLVGINERDRPFVTPAFVRGCGLAFDLGEWREKLHRLEEAGFTGVTYQPAGPDIQRELEAFAQLF